MNVETPATIHPTGASVPPAPAVGLQPSRRRRRQVRAGGLAVVVTAAVLVAGGAVGGGGDAPVDDAATATATAQVSRRTLAQEEELDGTLGYAGSYAVVNQRQGTLTGHPAEGAVIDRGQVLYEVDGQPVYLMVGDRPAWRQLDEAVDDGPDVRQLEENLVALGHASDQNLTVDDDFTEATTAAVKRWQEAIGADEDGVVELGEIVFLPDGLRVTDRPVDLGTQVPPGTPVLEGTSPQRTVTVDLDARRQGLVAAGDAVEIELPDGTRTPGTIASVGTVATAPEDGGGGGEGEGAGGAGEGGSDPTVEVVVSLTDPGATGSLDQAPVEVVVDRNRVDDVLAVPVSALLALAEGGYAVEVDEGGRRRLVGVELGLFADGMVEVRGEGLSEGMAVVVPV
ncbi:MAG: peptidoglycan-binding protein [Actinomycetota bacterium]|nr:peptidoglycan-binding protein [Actinomycetota bacterium]